MLSHLIPYCYPITIRCYHMEVSQVMEVPQKIIQIYRWGETPFSRNHPAIYKGVAP